MPQPDELHGCESDVIGHVRHHLEHARRCRQDHRLPYVTVTYAQSLDGSIARSEGETLQLSNSYSQRLTHQVRAVHDAILVGINTVVRDNPRLNVRLVDGENPQPVVVDSRLRFPLDANLLRDPCVRPIIVASDRASDKKESRLTDLGAKVFRVSERDDGLLELAQIFTFLKRFEYQSVMVEGGASIITNMLTSRLAHQLLLTISPRFVGGLRAVNPQHGSASDRMPRLRNVQYQWLKEDLIIRGDLNGTDDQVADWLSEPSTECGTAPSLDSSPGNRPTEEQ